MVTCNSFLKEDGILFLGTRNKGKAEYELKNAVSTAKVRNIQFFDKNDFSITYRNGVWTKQKFHTLNSLEEMCSKYFNNVKCYGKEISSQIYAICTKKKKLDKKLYHEALNTELNMEYPNGYRHNCHLVLLELLINLNN